MQKSNSLVLCPLLLVIGIFIISIQAQADCDLPATTHTENIVELTGQSYYFKKYPEEAFLRHAGL